MSSDDSLEFFMKGLIIECFSCWGIFPVSREVSIISLKSVVSLVGSLFVRDSGRGQLRMNI